MVLGAVRLVGGRRLRGLLVRRRLLGRDPPCMACAATAGGDQSAPPAVRKPCCAHLGRAFGSTVSAKAMLLPPVLGERLASPRLGSSRLWAASPSPDGREGSRPRPGPAGPGRQTE